MIAAYQHLWGTMGSFLRPFLATAIAVVLLTPFMMYIAYRFQILDIPNERKMHTKPIPRLGGLALLLGFWIVSLFHLPWTKEFTSIVIGATIIAAMGIADDIKPLSSRIRLFGQVLAAGIVMWAGLMVSFMPKVWWGQAVAVVITLVWILGIVNALNFADGLDGLASGISFIAAFFFFLMSVYLRQLDVALVAVLTAGCCLGFLIWNFKPAKIYLGDGGSTFLGFLLACIALYGGWSEDGFIVALGIPTVILGVLIFDMIYITVARIKNGKVRNVQQWLDYTAKDHFHHRLMSMGFSDVMAVVFIYLVCIILGINVLVLEKLRNPLGVTILFIHALLVFVVIFLLMRVGHELRDKRGVNAP